MVSVITRSFTPLLALLLWLTSGALTPAHGTIDVDLSQGEWQPLFNGRDLSGWQPKIAGHAYGVNAHDTFRVNNGLLQVRYDGYDEFAGQFGHLFYEQPFSHYAVHIVYRFVGEQAPGGPAGWAVRNSGVMLHSQDPASMGLDQDFPDSIEAQFLGGLSDGKPRPTGNLCTPGMHVHLNGKLFTPHCTPSTSPTLDGDQWVSMTVVVLGAGRIRHLVNGEEVLTYSHPQLDRGDAHAGKPSLVAEGYIALQSESHPIDFKTVAILDLTGCTDSTASNFKPYAIKRTPGSCRYDAD